MRKQWAIEPQHGGLPEDIIDETYLDLSPLMYAAVGGSMIIYAGAWPRMPPSDFRVRSLDGIADDWPLTYDELLPYYERSDRHFGVSGTGWIGAYSARRRGSAAPPAADRRGRAQGRPGARPTGLALVAGAECDPVRAVRRSPPVRPAGHVPAGLQRGRQGLHGPDPLAQGDRRGRPPHHRRARPPTRDERRGSRDRRDVGGPRRPRAFRVGQGRRPCRERHRDTAAAPALRRRRRTPTASPTRPASSGDG